MSEFRLPDIGEGLDQAEIVEWLVEVGDTITRDQPLVEILTDKSQTQLPAPDAGVVTRLGAEIGDLLPVGEVVIEYETGHASASTRTSPDTAPISGATKPSPPPNQATTSPTTAAATATATAMTATAQPQTQVAPTSDDSRARPKASPAVRKQALTSGIDLHDVAGTGPGGRITAADLTDHMTRPEASIHGLAASGPATSGLPPGQGLAASGLATSGLAAATPQTLGQAPPGTTPLRGIRRVTAETMQRAWTVPHIHGADEFDATALMEARAALRSSNQELAAVLTPLTFMVMAVANALRTFPLINASLDLDAGEIHVHPDINVGVAVSTDRGLLVPVIRNADRLGLAAMATEIRRLTTAARNGSVTADELRGGTCTVTNYGSLGGRFSAPIIKPPESAIVGFGSIRERPFVVNGAVEARRTLPIATAADHRLIDGDLMTAFQEHIIGLLLAPIVLVAR